MLPRPDCIVEEPSEEEDERSISSPDDGRDRAPLAASQTSIGIDDGASRRLRLSRPSTPSVWTLLQLARCFSSAARIRPSVTFSGESRKKASFPPWLPSSLSLSEPSPSSMMPCTSTPVSATILRSASSSFWNDPLLLDGDMIDLALNSGGNNWESPTSRAACSGSEGGRLGPESPESSVRVSEGGLGRPSAVAAARAAGDTDDCLLRSYESEMDRRGGGAEARKRWREAPGPGLEPDPEKARELEAPAEAPVRPAPPGWGLARENP